MRKILNFNTKKRKSAYMRVYYFMSLSLSLILFVQEVLFVFVFL